MKKKPSIRYRDWLAREATPAPAPASEPAADAGGSEFEPELVNAEHAEHTEKLRETAETAIQAVGETTIEPAVEAATEPTIEPTIAATIETTIETTIEAAIEPAAPPAPPAEREHLVFRVGRELFALPLDAVDEAIDIESVQHLPEMRAAMLGVVSLRGSLVPLYAPAATLGVAAAHGSAALVFVTPRGRVALAVDDVDDVMDIAPDALQRAPMDFGDGVLVGVARRGGDLIGVLDAGALMGACRAEPVLETA